MHNWIGQINETIENIEIKENNYNLVLIEVNNKIKICCFKYFEK